MQNIVAVW